MTRKRALGLACIAVGAGLVVAGLAPAMPWRGPVHGPARLVETARAPHVAPPVPPSPDVAVANPLRIAIPSIDLVANLAPLGLEPDGSLALPEDFSLAGWYTDGPEPGEPGAAVIAGHVDSRDGPAVFFRLRELAPRDLIVIETGDGASLTFAVERVERHAKDRFPTAAVYGSTTGPALRLITCGGPFDRATRRYRDNLVVFASPVTQGTPFAG